MKVNNFTVIESEYGKFIVNRHCAFQADVLIKTGRPHIQKELNKILAIVNTLPEHSVAIDAGANIGLVSIPLAQLVKSKHGIVHAYEPQRMMANALCGSAALNDLENLYVYNQALGIENKMLLVEIPSYDKPQDFGLFNMLEQSSAATEPVYVRSIDSLELPRLDFLKIDVEGMEIDVLKGACQTLKQNLPWCWVEYWKLSIDDIKAQFEGLEYQFYKMDELNMLCAPSDKLAESVLNINAKEV